MAEEKRQRGRPKKSDIADSNVNNNTSNQSVSSNEPNIVGNQNQPLNQTLNQIDNNDIPDDNNISDNSVNSGNNSFQQTEEVPVKKTFKKPSNNQSSFSDNSSNSELEDEIDRELAEFEKTSGLNDIPDYDFNPHGEPVKKRAYTDGSMGMNNPDDNSQGQGNSSNAQGNGNPDNVIYRQDKGSEKVIDEPRYTGVGHSRKPDVDASLINPSNSGGEGVLDTPDDNYYNQQNNNKKSSGGGGGNNNSGGGGNKNNGGGSGGGNNNNSGGGSGSSGQSSDKKAEKVETKKELSPKEKKENAEQGADVILLAYKNYIPPLFVYFAQHNVKKLKKLEKEGELDLSRVIKRDGTTILDYVADFNKQVEVAFKISPEEIEAIRPALVDVLMENEVAFTPTQRLMFVVGQFIVAKIMLLIKFIQQKKSDIAEMREFHLEEMAKLDEIRKQNAEILKRGNVNQAQNQGQTQTQNQNQNQTFNSQGTNQTQNQQQNNNANNAKENTHSNIRIVKNETKEDNAVKDAEVISETKKESSSPEKTPTLDDVLETDLNEEDNKNNDDNQDIPD